MMNYLLILSSVVAIQNHTISLDDWGEMPLPELDESTMAFSIDQSSGDDFDYAPANDFRASRRRRRATKKKSEPPVVLTPVDIPPPVGGNSDEIVEIL